MFERRTRAETVEARDDEGALYAEGYAFRNNTYSEDMGGFVEQVMPGAARKTVQEQDIMALFNHNEEMLLGRTSSGTLTLEEISDGLRYSVRLPDTTHGRDVAELLQRRDLQGSSFSFQVVGDAGSEWGYTDAGYPLRSLREFRMRDVGPVPLPAYSASSADVAYRSLSLSKGISFDEVRAAGQEKRLQEIMRESEKPKTIISVPVWL